MNPHQTLFFLAPRWVAAVVSPCEFHIIDDGVKQKDDQSMQDLPPISPTNT
jgi:hypothetical protein